MNHKLITIPSSTLLHRRCSSVMMNRLPSHTNKTRGALCQLYSTGRSFVPSSEGEHQQQSRTSSSSSFQHRVSSSSSSSSQRATTSTSVVDAPTPESPFSSRPGVKPSMKAGRSTVKLSRWLITAGIIAGLAYGAYNYYDENVGKLDKEYYKRLEKGSGNSSIQTTNANTSSSSSSTDTPVTGQQKRSGFFVPKARTLRNQFIVTRTRVYEIEICRGDILDEKTDAIVCSVNSNLDVNQGDLAQMIADRVGDQYKRETKEYVSKHEGAINYGDVAVVKAGGDLRCRYVIQACSPVWEGGEKLEIFNLSQAVYNALTAADKLGLESISIPAIGSGVYRFPKEKCAQVIIDTVAAYFNDRDFTKSSARTNKKCLNKVRLINADDQAVDAFVKEFDHKKKMGKFLV